MTALDDEFNLRKRHPQGVIHMALNSVQSVIARRRLKHSADVSYGNSAGEKMDVFPSPAPDSPVLVFIHGGYFRALDKKQYSYIAPAMVHAGVTIVVINYDLAPDAAVKKIVSQCRTAFIWITRHIHKWNGNNNKILLCGHSVGAFLCMKIMEEEQAHTQSAVIGACLLSGLYDLTNMRKSYLNASVRLSKEDVRELNPDIKNLSNMPPTLVAVGEDESNEFIQQSNHISSALRETGANVTYQLLHRKNHYSVSRMLGKRESQLTRHMLWQLNGVQR